MQTLDVQNDMQPVNYADAVQSSNQDKKNVKEPEVKGSSFIDIIKKLMAEESDGRLAGEETMSGSAVEAQEAAEQTARKKNAAAQTELSRLKSKAGKFSDPNAQHRAEADAQTGEAAGALADADELRTLEDGIDVKDALEKSADTQLKTSIAAQVETDAVPEGAALLSAEEAPQLKKQKNGKAESGLTVGTAASGTVALSGMQKKDAAESAGESALEKSAKAQQVKQHKPIFTIIDERTVNAAPVTADGSVHEAGAAVRVTTAPSVDMAADFRSMTAGFGSAASGTQATASGSGAPSFASLVAQQVQDMAPDFVQAGRIVLQDNNAGVIRLQMQPAHLGNVRINLELAGDKKIVGKIIAGSKEAYEAFKESIEQLAKAFEEGGFASAQFDVSWSGEGGGQFDGENGQFNELFAQNDQLEVMHGNRYADTETVYAFGQDQAVNVFA